MHKINILEFLVRKAETWKFELEVLPLCHLQAGKGQGKWGRGPSLGRVGNVWVEGLGRDQLGQGGFGGKWGFWASGRFWGLGQHLDFFLVVRDSIFEGVDVFV